MVELLLEDAELVILDVVLLVILEMLLDELEAYGKLELDELLLSLDDELLEDEVEESLEEELEVLFDVSSMAELLLDDVHEESVQLLLLDEVPLVVELSIESSGDEELLEDEALAVAFDVTEEELLE